MTINTPSTFAAPFGLLYGTIRNVALTNESLSGNGAAGLVGNNVGTIDGVSVTGLVSGGLVGAGGLVGDNNGAIASSSVNATVQSSRGASGGLASSNFGNITQSSSSGSVSAQFDGAVGGLVGVNYGGTISESFSTASVASTGTFSGPAMVGGLIGWNQNSPTIHDVYATGSVSGPGFTDTGGLIGRDNAASGSIARGYAAGSVSGGFFAGGLVGRNTAFNYTNVYWDTSATGQGFSTGSGTLVGTGVPTNLLKVNLPTGFNGSVWGQSNAVNGGYPFLLWQTGTGSPSPPIVLTGSLPAAITLYYVADPKPSIYGQPIPTLTGTVTGLLPGDSLATATTGTLQFSTTASSASIVGTYPIVGFGLTALGNYVLAQAAANATAYTINPATLTITAKD